MLGQPRAESYIVFFIPASPHPHQVTSQPVVAPPKVPPLAGHLFFGPGAKVLPAPIMSSKVTSSGGEVETYDVTVTLKPAPAPQPSAPSKQKGDSL